MLYVFTPTGYSGKVDGIMISNMQAQNLGTPSQTCLFMDENMSNKIRTKRENLVELYEVDYLFNQLLNSKQIGRKVLENRPI